MLNDSSEHDRYANRMNARDTGGIISAVVLAAGESKRMGRPKQLLEWPGGTLLQHILDNIAESNIDEIVLVLGHEAEKIMKNLPVLRTKLPDRRTFHSCKDTSGLTSNPAPQHTKQDLRITPPVKIAINANYGRGMLSSLKQGLLAINPKSEAFLVFLGDQPGIGPEITNQIIQYFLQAGSGKCIIRPVCMGRRGHPLLIGIQHLQEILKLHDDGGIRQLLANHPDDILEIEVDQDAVLKDIDTPEEYTAYRKLAHKPF